MKNDDKLLIGALRGAGHDDIADTLERKALEDGLEEAGRGDLAAQLSSPPPPAAQTPGQSADDQLLAEVRAKSEGAWSSSSSLFGG